MQEKLIKIIRLFSQKNRVLYATLSAVIMLCLLGLGLFDIDRGTEAINLMGTLVLEEKPQLVYIGIFWVVCAFIEFYLVITPNHHKVVQWYRIILTGFIPAYIIYKVKFLGIDLYSADILVFVILPVCQIGMAVVNALSDEYDDFNDISFLDNR